MLCEALIHRLKSHELNPGTPTDMHKGFRFFSVFIVFKEIKIRAKTNSKKNLKTKAFFFVLVLEGKYLNNKTEN